MAFSVFLLLLVNDLNFIYGVIYFQDGYREHISRIDIENIFPGWIQRIYFQGGY